MSTITRTAISITMLLVVLGAPSAAHAATCSDYSTQAAAQAAADTRDADGDGIYCEALRCPCSAAAGGSGGGGGGAGSTPIKPASTTPARVKLGPSITLAPWSKHSGCHVDGALPDHR